MWENRRRDRITAGMAHQENVEFMDLTDMKNLMFRVSEQINTEAKIDSALLILSAVFLLIGIGSYEWYTLFKLFYV